jgi:3-oxoacyl-[acyl-carrier-protein] synthase III
MPARISAISYYLPEKVYSNEDFYADFPEAVGSSLEKVGVKKRHLVAPGETASDMAMKAAEKLFEEHGIERSSIDFLILSILEPDYYSPPTSCVLHGKLGLNKNCGTLDYAHGCSAYVYGLGMADGVISTMGAKRVLLITTSTLSHTIHPADKASRFVFGDGSAATLIEFDAKNGLGPYEYGTDGSGYKKIIIEDGYARNPITTDSYKELKDEYGNIASKAHFRMEGVDVFLFTARTVPVMIRNLLEKSGLTIDEVDHFVFHQPNVFLNETLRKKIGIPQEKFIHYMAETGNTVQSTIPIALYELMKQKKIKSGDTVVLAGFGVGLSWIATIARF